MAQNASGRGAGMTFSRRSLLMGGAALATTGALAACGSNSGSGNTGTSGGGGGGGEIAHWDWFVSQESWVENEIKLFQDANPDWTVDRTLTQTDQYPDVVSLSQRSGGLPDVLMVPNQPALNEQVTNGWLTPLNDLADDAWVKQFPAYSFVEGVNMFDGKIYSAPFDGAAPILQLFLNNQVFRDAGLADADGKARFPTTWDEVTEFAATITEKGGGKVFGLGAGNTEGIVLYQWNYVFLQAAGSPNGIDFRTGGYTYGSDPNYTRFYTLMKQWFDDGLFHPDTLSTGDEVARAKFAAGEIGMIVGGSWNIGGWRDDHQFEDYSVTTLIGPEPEPRGYFSSSPGGKHIAISADVKDAEAAFRWFSWWNGPEAGARWVQDYTLGLSIFPEANDPAGITFEPFKDFVALAPLTRRAPVPAIRNPDVAMVQNPGVTPSFSDVVTGIMTGQITDIQGAFDDLEKRSNEGLDAAIADAVAAGANVTREDYLFEDWDPTQDYAYEGLPEYPTL